MSIGDDYEYFFRRRGEVGGYHTGGLAFGGYCVSHGWDSMGDEKEFENNDFRYDRESFYNL